MDRKVCKASKDLRDLRVIPDPLGMTVWMEQLEHKVRQDLTEWLDPKDLQAILDQPVMTELMGLLELKENLDHKVRSVLRAHKAKLDRASS